MRAASHWADLSRGSRIGEDFGCERFDLCALLPSVQWEARFAAGFREKSAGVPAMLARDLRQEEPAAAKMTDDQSVSPYFDLLGANLER